MIRCCALLICLTSLFGAAPDAPTEAELLKGMEKSNGKPHKVNPHIAFLCRSRIPAEWKMHKEKFGPHAVLIDIYLNEKAKDAIDNNKAYAVGSVIIKKQVSTTFDIEKIIGGMVKMPKGYDDKNKNWRYFTLSDKGVYATGKMPSCVNCHTKTKTGVYGTWKPRDPIIPPPLDDETP